MAKIWKKLLLVILIVACLFNVVSKIEKMFPEPFYDILYFYQIFHSLNPLCLQQMFYKPDSIASSVYVFDFFIMINPVTRIIAISTARIYHSGTASSLLK